MNPDQNQPQEPQSQPQQPAAPTQQPESQPQVIDPNQQAQPQVQPEPQAAPDPTPPPIEEPAPQPEQAPEQQNFQAEVPTAAAQNFQTQTEAPIPEQPTDNIQWQASEFIHHEKNFGWFAVFFIATALVMVGMYVILEDILSIVVIGLMSIALAVFANRKPRTLSYSISSEGVMVGDKAYAYESFRSFAVMDDGGIENIILDPIQKLMPPITVYVSADDVDRIVDVLSHYLPHEDKQLDWVDRFAKRIRF